MTDDVDHMLSSLGSSAVPAPDPAFADALEVTLRTAVVASTGSTLSVRRVGRWPTTVAAVAFAASIVAIGLVVWQDSPAQQIYVTGATNAEVVMPAGQTIPAVVGLVLPEGSQVVTGVDGWASFGNEELGPNTFAVVDSSGIDKDATLALGAGPSVAITTTLVPTTVTAPAPSSSAPTTSGGVVTTALVATASSTIGDIGDIGVATSIVAPTAETVTTDTALVTTTRPRGVTPEPPIGTTTTSLVAATTVPVGLPPTTAVAATTSVPDSTTSSTAAVATTSSTTDDPLDGTGTTSTTTEATTTTTTTSSTSSTSTTSTSSSTTSTTSTTEARDRKSAT